MIFFHLAEEAYLELNELLPTLNTMIGKMNSFKN
jgi:hypothetical protein